MTKSALAKLASAAVLPLAVHVLGQPLYVGSTQVNINPVAIR